MIHLGFLLAIDWNALALRFVCVTVRLFHCLLAGFCVSIFSLFEFEVYACAFAFACVYVPFALAFRIVLACACIIWCWHVAFPALECWNRSFLVGCRGQNTLLLGVGRDVQSPLNPGFRNQES